MIESIQQGDQYGLPVSITVDGKKAIPGQPELGDDTHIHVDDVRVQIGEFLKSSEDGEVIYDGEKDTWIYPITEYESRRIGTGRVEIQKGVRLGDQYIYTPVETVQVDRSLIRLDWGQSDDPGGPLSWLGRGALLIENNISDFSFSLDDTDYSEWTPSSTVHTLIPMQEGAPIELPETDRYDYFFIWEWTFTPAYVSDVSALPRPLRCVGYFLAAITRTFSEQWTSWETNQRTQVDIQNILSLSAMRYLATNGTKMSVSNGEAFYFDRSSVPSAVASGSHTTTIIKPRRPAFFARTSPSMFFSDAAAAAIDTANSKGHISGKLVRVKRESIKSGWLSQVRRLQTE